MALRASEEARQIDTTLHERGMADSQRFKHLKEAAERRSKEPVKATKSTTGWSDKIAKMREEYPNAYRPWKGADDAVLKQGFQTGVSVAELSKQLGRH